MQAFLLNYFLFLCSTVNSPLATSITGNLTTNKHKQTKICVGQLKSILQTIFGLFTFGGVTLTFSLSVGLLTSTMGGIWYGYIKYAEQANTQKKMANAESQRDVENAREDNNNK